MLPVDLALDRLGVRIDQQLGGIEPVALVRGVRPVDPEAVALAGPDTRQVAVVVLRPAPGHLDARVSRRRRRTGTARRARRARRRSRSSCRAPSQWAPSGNGLPGQTSISGPPRPTSAAGSPRRRPASRRRRRTARRPRAWHRERRVSAEKLNISSCSPRRTRSQRVIARRNRSPRLASWPRSSRRERQQLARRARRAPRRAPGSAWSRSNVCSDLRVGDLLRRTTRTPRTPGGARPAWRWAISSSMWSEKNWNGAGSPYSSPMNSIGTNGDSSVQNAASGRAGGGQAVAERAVSDLVVVLVEDDEALRRHVVGRRPEAPAAKARVGAVVDVRAVKGLGQMRDPAELRVVAVALVGHQRAQRVVEVVGPRGVAAVAAAVSAGASRAGSLSPLSAITSGVGADRMDPPRDRGDDVLGARVEDRVDRVEAQPVDAEVAHPALGALEHPFAHRVAAGVVVVDRPAPRRLVLGGEVRPERLQRRRPRRRRRGCRRRRGSPPGRARARRATSCESPCGPP